MFIQVSALQIEIVQVSIAGTSWICRFASCVVSLSSETPILPSVTSADVKRTAAPALHGGYYYKLKILNQINL